MDTRFIHYSVLYCYASICAINPTKLVDRIGKILTPILLIVIGLLALKSFFTPMGSIGAPLGSYGENAFFESFVQGYLTMDVIAASCVRYRCHQCSSS